MRSKDAKVKAKVGMEESNKVNSTQDEDVPTGRFAEKGDFGGKKVVVEEANEFLRIIQQSEFKVIEQLNKTPARSPCWNYARVVRQLIFDARIKRKYCKKRKKAN